MRLENFGYVSSGGNKHHAVDLDGVALCGKQFDALCSFDTGEPIILADHWVLDDDFCLTCLDLLFTKTDYGKRPSDWRCFPQSWLIIKRGSEF